jgi:thiol-disulfide isomerase/thioredoxin
MPLDSTSCVNGHFVFRIKSDSIFYPYKASINFADSSSRVGITSIFFRNYMLGADSVKYSGSAFYLEKGYTYIEGDNAAKPAPRVYAGKENDLFFKNQMSFFGWPDSNDSTKRNKQIAHFKSDITSHPFSYYLLSGIFGARERYSKPELEELFGLFDKEVHQSAAGKAFTHYLQVRHVEGEPYPNLLLSDSSNKKELVMDKKAPINMLVFWASWCGPCRQEIPVLKEFYKTYQSKGVRLVSISIDEHKDAWKTAMAQEKMNWPQYLVDEKDIKEVEQQYNFSSIPLIIITDGAGKEIGRFVGYSSDGSKEYIAAIEKALKAQ